MPTRRRALAVAAAGVAALAFPGRATAYPAVDGYWGTDTTKMLQSYFGLSQTGCVCHQWADNRQAALTGGWEWDYTGYGDQTVRSLQSLLGTTVDGLLGTSDIKALQRRMGTYVDGTLSAGSECVKALQRRLLNGYI